MVRGLQPVFGPQYSLHDGGERAFILTGLDASTTTTDPARLLDADIGPALPGADRAGTATAGDGNRDVAARLRAERRPRAGPQAAVLRVVVVGRELQSRPRFARCRKHGHVELYGGDPLIGGLGRAWRIGRFERRRRRLRASKAPGGMSSSSSQW